MLAQIYKVERLSLEEALKFQNRKEVPEWKTEEQFIIDTTREYNLLHLKYTREKKESLEELEKECARRKETYTELSIQYQTFEEYYSTPVDEPAFTAWGKKYLYVRCTSAGETSVKSFLRNPPNK